MQPSAALRGTIPLERYHSSRAPFWSLS
jgi:hypothetical protein